MRPFPPPAPDTSSGRTAGPLPLSGLNTPPLAPASAIHAAELRWQRAHADDALTEKAGAAAAGLAAAALANAPAPLLVLAGPGRQGAIALASAPLLAQRGFHVTVASRDDPVRQPPEGARAYAAWRAGGGACLSDLPSSCAYGLVIDGLGDAGQTPEWSAIETQWIARVNAMPCRRLSLDAPAGLDGDTGKARATPFAADTTLSFIGIRPGLLTADGPDCAGEIFLDPLGVALSDAPGFALVRRQARHRLPPRRRNSHKGQFGHVGILGGAPGMVGAALLAGRAALAYGAGVVTLGVLDARVAVDYGEPRLMFAPPERLVAAPLDVLALGPGLGQAAQARALLGAALASACPLVLDADALNLLAGDPALSETAARRSAPVLLTPHPGEAARLLACGTGDVQADRIAAAGALARRFHAHVALKGAGTVVAHPQGRYAINTTGGPHLAQAGSGDRLTGIVVALLAQGMAPGDALEAAVWLHGSEPAIPPTAI